jgi:hypothetical protein
MNGDPASCSRQAGHSARNAFEPRKWLASVKMPSSVVPWLEGDSPISACTLAAPPRFLR